MRQVDLEEVTGSPGNLPIVPDVSTARLPMVYEAAINALAECSKLDECQQWADKAEALASYARQAEDESMRKYADRIQARAIRRCGELLKQIPSGTGAHLKSEGAHTLSTQQPTRKQAADEAGMSPHQRVQAIRVASVPTQEFERMVEGEQPPTVTQLAEMGKQARPAKDAAHLGTATADQFKAATQALGILRDFVKFASATDAAVAARGVQPTELARAREFVALADAWLDKFIISLGS